MTRRRVYFLSTLLLLVCSVLTGNIIRHSTANEGRHKPLVRQSEPVKIKIVPWGPDQQTFDAAIEFLNQHPALKKALGGAKYRQLSFGTIDGDFKDGSPRLPPTRFHAVYYDYSNNRVVTADGNLDRTGPVNITEDIYQPPVDGPEFSAAVAMLARDATVGPKIKARQLIPYAPMPPVVYPDKPGSRIDRIVNVGLSATGDGIGPDNQIVGVNMGREQIVRFPNNAPPASKADVVGCGLPACGAPTCLGPVNRGTPGQVQVTITQGPDTLWQMLVIRPSVSSGNDGSGIEFRDVRYRGKMVLKRMHIPVLNVQYVDTCGPYRDWQYGETYFKIDPNSPPEDAPGIRRSSPAPAKTIVDDRDDTGNYRGVAYYTQGEETVFVTELSAAWYRYANEYRFGNDGTINPRFAFGSTLNGCVCIRRAHHTYWRFDFDVDGSANSLFDMRYGRNQPQQITNEMTMYREGRVRWLIENPTTGSSYVIIPGPADGTAAVNPFTGIDNDFFAQSDMWALHYQGTAASPGEVDDIPNGSAINLSSYLTDESLDNQDIVIWYGAHVVRQDDTSLTGKNILSGVYVVGPTLKPVKW